MFVHPSDMSRPSIFQDGHIVKRLFSDRKETHWGKRKLKARSKNLNEIRRPFNGGLLRRFVLPLERHYGFIAIRHGVAALVAIVVASA